MASKFASVGNLSCAPPTEQSFVGFGKALVSDRKVVIDREVGQVGLQRLAFSKLADGLGQRVSRRRASIEGSLHVRIVAWIGHT